MRSTQQALLFKKLLFIILFSFFLLLGPSVFANNSNGLDVQRPTGVTITPEMFGAIGDGVANDTVAFELMTNFMAEHNATAVVTGDYLVDSVELFDNSHIIGDGGVLRKIPSNEMKYAIITLNNNCMVEGLTLIGDRDHNNTTGEWGHCIYIKGDNCRVKNCTTINPHGDGIYVHGNDAHVDGCVVERAYRNGISVTDSINFLIENTSISNVQGTAPEYGIDIEPNNAQDSAVGLIRNVDIVNCCGGLVIHGNSKQINPFYITCENTRIIKTNSKNAIRFKNYVYNGDCYTFSNIWIINPAADTAELLSLDFLGENNPKISLSAKIVGETGQKIASIYTKKNICDNFINLSILSDNTFSTGNAESMVYIDSLNPNINLHTDYHVVRREN